MNGYVLAQKCLTIVALLAFLTEIVFIVRWFKLFMTKSKDIRAKRISAIGIAVSLFITGTALFANYYVAVNQYTKEFGMDKLQTFTVESESLGSDGAWAQETGKNHGNVSPHLKWAPVEGATKYAIVMVDPDGSDWLHMYTVADITELKSGQYTNSTDQYVGPYPPQGTHNYEVYVFALRGDPYEVSERLDASGAKIDNIVSELNSGPEVEYGNVISYGKIVGTYSAD